MENIFNTILEMTLSSSIVIIIVLLARAVLKNKLPKVFSYAIWAIVLIRLMIPIGFESQFSVFNYISTPSFIVEKSNISQQNYNSKHTEVQDTATLIEEMPNNDISIDNIKNYKEVPKDGMNTKGTSGFYNIAYIWLLMVLAMLIYFMVCYIKFMNKLDDAYLFPTNHTNRMVYVSDKVDTPVLVGLIKPRIVLPKALDVTDDELHYIINHELIHIKRFDYIIKSIALFVLCIHWFNPLVWVSYFIAMKDMELSCDEAVMTKYSKPIKTNYANTLLNISIRQNKFFNGGMVAFGEKNIQSRIKAALNFKKIPMSLKIIGVVLICILSLVLVSNSNETKKMVKVLEKQYGYEIKDGDILEVIESKDEALLFHIGYNKEREYPVVILSKVEKKGLSWIYRGAAYDNRTLDELEENNSTIMIHGIGDLNQSMVQGVAKGINIDKVLISNRFGELRDLEANTIKINDSVTLWYTVIEQSSTADYVVKFIDKNGLVLSEIGKTIMDNPLKTIEKLRGYEVPKDNVIGITATELGTIVFYQRKIGGGATVYAFELLEEVSSGYRWLMGGQHSDGSLDKGEKNVSSVQHQEHISETIPEGLIFGVTDNKVEDIVVSKGPQYSYAFSQVETIEFGDGYTLWYQILSENFGETYEVTFSNKNGIIFSKSNANKIIGKRLDTNETPIDTNDVLTLYKENEIKKIKLPPYPKHTDDLIETLVYGAALGTFGRNDGYQDIVIIAPHISGSFEEGNYLKIFATILSESFKLDGDILVADSGSNIPTAFIFKKLNSRSYALDEYIKAKDGAEYAPSIREFTSPHEEIAKEMIDTQDYIEEQQRLLLKNIKEYVEHNNLDVKYVEFPGKEKIELK